MNKSITIPFLDEFRERMLSGQKTATTRTRKYGDPGDLFSAFGYTFQLIKVSRVYLGEVAFAYHKQEGFESKDDFMECWCRIHPRKRHYTDIVWLHEFERVA